MYIGLDLGTSGLKGIVIDDAQTICAEATAPLHRGIQGEALQWL